MKKLLFVLGVSLILFSACVENAENDPDVNYNKFQNGVFYFKYPASVQLVSTPNIQPIRNDGNFSYMKLYKNRTDNRSFLFDLEGSDSGFFFDDLDGKQWYMQLSNATEDDLKDIADSLNFFSCPDNLYKSFGAKFCMDDSYLYRNDEIVSIEPKDHKLDLETFEILSPRYARDKNSVYAFFTNAESFGKGSSLDPLNDANGLTIRRLDSDLGTFEVLNNEYAKDSNNVYRYGVIFDADFSTFEILDEDFARDKNFVFYRGTKIDGADPKSFEGLGMWYSKDKNHVYRETEIVEDADLEKILAPRNGYSLFEGYLWNGSVKLSNKRAYTLLTGTAEVWLAPFEWVKYELDGKIYIYPIILRIGVGGAFPAPLSNKYFIIDKQSNKIDIENISSNDFENWDAIFASVAPDQKSFAYVDAIHNEAAYKTWDETVWVYDFVTQKKQKIMTLPSTKTLLTILAEEIPDLCIDDEKIYWDKNGKLITQPSSRQDLLKKL